MRVFPPSCNQNVIDDLEDRSFIGSLRSQNCSPLFLISFLLSDGALLMSARVLVVCNQRMSMVLASNNLCEAGFTLIDPMFEL